MVALGPSIAENRTKSRTSESRHRRRLTGLPRSHNSTASSLEILLAFLSQSVLFRTVLTPGLVPAGARQLRAAAFEFAAVKTGKLDCARSSDALERSKNISKSRDKHFDLRTGRACVAQVSAWTGSV